MKKVISITMAVLLLLSAGTAFAGNGSWLGPTALYGDILSGDDELKTLREWIDNADSYQFDIDNVSYGLEKRIHWGIFQANATAIYLSQSQFKALQTTLGAGLYADFGMVGLGLTGGPTYFTFLSDFDGFDGTFELKNNVKASVDLILGETLFSLYFLGYVDDLHQWIRSSDSLGDVTGQVGVSMLFQM
ncbi:MAG: hypothetical protein ACQEQU_04590 [Spirochaetota bacterium]